MSRNKKTKLIAPARETRTPGRRHGRAAERLAKPVDPARDRVHNRIARIHPAPGAEQVTPALVDDLATADVEVQETAALLEEAIIMTSFELATGTPRRRKKR